MALKNLRLARRAQPQGPGAADKALPEIFPAPVLDVRPQAAVHPADAAARGRRLLACAPAARRPARPRARCKERHAGGLDLAAGRGPQGRPAEELPASARALSRARIARGRGYCCVCGQPVYRLGWHVDLWDTGPNPKRPGTRPAWSPGISGARRATRCACSGALQERRCRESGKRLLKTAEVDHRMPLFQVWQEHRDLPWPQLLGFWGLPNLQAHQPRSPCGQMRGRSRLSQPEACGHRGGLSQPGNCSFTIRPIAKEPCEGVTAITLFAISLMLPPAA